MLKASLPRWCATSPMARHTWPVRVAAIPLHATTIRETIMPADRHPQHSARNLYGPGFCFSFALPPSRCSNPTYCYAAALSLMQRLCR